MKTYQSLFDPDEENVINTTILECVGRATDNDPTAMDPIYETIDPDALDKLFQHENSQVISVNFTYLGCDVTVMGEGEVRVEVSDRD